jgi:hypothetical protein
MVRAKLFFVEPERFLHQRYGAILFPGPQIGMGEVVHGDERVRMFKPESFFGQQECLLKE